MTDKTTIDLGREVTIRLKDQEARYLLGALSYIELNLGKDLDPDDLIVHLADSGVNPEVDSEVDLLSQAKASINNRQEFKPQVFEIGRLHSICHVPPIWMLSYIDLIKKAQTREEEDHIFSLFEEHNPHGLDSLKEWLDRTYQEKQQAEAQAYGYLEAMINLGILDADHAGEILQDYRPGGKFNP